MQETRTTRRGVLGTAAGGLAAAGLGQLAGKLPQADAALIGEPQVSKGKTKVVVLGSQGGQQMNQVTGANVRCGTSILIDVGGELTVLDCGCGSAHSLNEAGYDMNKVRRIVITHFHMDHVSDLSSFASFAWSSGRNGLDPDRRLDIYGPKGTKLYESGMKKALSISIADQEGPLGQVPTFGEYARWHQIDPRPKHRTVFSDDTISATAVRVNHGTVPAVGYRIRTADLDMVFSGDRGAKGDGFIKFATGADVLFHEILNRDIVIPVLEAQGQSKTFIEHLVNDHSDPKAVGHVATKAGVPNLVLYHLIPGSPAVADPVWKASILPYYRGNVIVARDQLVV